jgi:molybdopterin-dependent oxidoreductase-like protein
LDLESTVSAKLFLNSFGCSNLNYQFNFETFFDFRFVFLLNSTILGLETLLLVFFFGVNLRAELPLLNIRLRKSFLQNDNFLLAFSLGLSLDYLSFPVINFGNNLLTFKRILEGRFFFLSYFLLKDFLCLKFINFKSKLIDKFSFFIGESILHRLDSNFLLSSFKSLLTNYSNDDGSALSSENLNIVSNYLGRLSCFEIGILPGVNGLATFAPNSFFYLFGVDKFFLSNSFFNESFVVYQGSFQELDFFLNVSLVFPVSIYVERSAFFFNLEGRLRKVKKAISAFKFVYSDLEIFKILFFFKSLIVEFNFLFLKSFGNFMIFLQNIIDYSCFFLDKIYLESITLVVPFFIKFLFLNFRACKLSNGIISRTLNNYFTSDIFSRNSKVMALCFLKSNFVNFSSNF